MCIFMSYQRIRMDNKISAAAMLYRNGRQKSKLHYQFGPQSYHTIYEGEGISTILSTKLVSKEWGAWSVIFYIDNLAIIMATQLTKPTSGHHIIDTLQIHSYTKSQKPQPHSHVQMDTRTQRGWGQRISRHTSKKSITEGSSNATILLAQLKDPLLYSKSAIKCAYSGKLQQKAQWTWEKSLWFNRMKDMEPTTPSKAYIKLIANLPRWLASTLTQLRTGHAPLAKHLHWIKKGDSPICTACLQRPETVQHLLLHCPAHWEARQALQNNTRGRNIDIKKLLTTPNTLKHMLKFITNTGRFHHLKTITPPN